MTHRRRGCGHTRPRRLALPAFRPGIPLYDLILEDATIISSTGRRVAHVAVEGGTITYIGDRPGGPARQTLSAAGKFVLPGLIDTHVHFRDPGHPHKEDWQSGSQAAATGGVTTVCDMPNTNPPTLRREDWEDKRRRAEARSVVDFGVWVGASRESLDDARHLSEEGGACGIKAFMGASTGPLLVDDATLERYFQETHALLGVHAEDEGALQAAAALHASDPMPRHHLVRPASAATLAVRRLIELTRAWPRPVHICHLSTAAEVELVEAADSLPITTEVTPHHLWLAAEDELGNFGKCNPPVRPDADRRAVWTALRRGQIDSVASDHAPHTRAEKERPYWEAPAGIPGVETTLPLLLGAVRQGRISVERVAQVCAEAPAAIFRFSKKGRIAVGYDADLVLFAEQDLVKLTPKDIVSRAGWSPFVGQRVAPKPEQVWVRGTLVAERGLVVDPTHRGRLVSPTRT